MKKIVQSECDDEERPNSWHVSLVWKLKCYNISCHSFLLILPNRLEKGADSRNCPSSEVLSSASVFVTKKMNSLLFSFSYIHDVITNILHKRWTDECLLRRLRQCAWTRKMLLFLTVNANSRLRLFLGNENSWNASLIFCLVLNLRHK